MRSGADRPAISTGPALMIPAGYPRDLPSALLRAARDFGAAGVVEIGPDGRETKLDFPTLLELAARILAGLRANGVRAGDPAVVHCTEPVGFFAAFWACTLGGIRPLLVAPNPGGDRTEEGRERLRKITDLLGWTVLIGRPSDLPNDLGLPVLDPDAMAGHEPTSDFHRPAADDVAVLMLSSGSTGTPKIVQLTHRGLVEFAAGTPAMLPVRPGQTTLNWLPLDRSGAFLLYHLLPVFTGCTNIHVNTDWVLANPLRWLDLMDQHRVNHSWSPNFGYRLATAAVAGEPDRHWDLSALRSLVSGGEQITVPVMSEFLRVTNRFGVVPETFVAAWGMTETVTGITFARPGLTPNVHRVRIPPTGVVEWVDQRPSSGKVAVARPGKPRTEIPGVLSLVSVGAPAPGTTVRIVAPNGAVLPEGRIGQLQVASARVTPGYLGNLEADRTAFPVGNWPARKWLATGDQGFITGGQVVITGRDSERIIMSGKLHYAHDIESVATTVVGAEHGLVAACGVADEESGTDRLVVFYALTPGSVPGMDQAIRSLIQTRLGLPAQVVGVPRRDFPTTPGGKILRPLLKQRWIDGTLLQPPAAPHVEPAGATPNSGPTGQGPSATPETTPYADEDPSERTTELPVVRLAWKRELQNSIPTPPERPTFGTPEQAQPSANQRSAEQPPTPQPSPDEPSADEPSAEVAAAEALDEQSAESAHAVPAAEPSTDQARADEATPAEALHEQSSESAHAVPATESSAKQPAADQPSSEQPPADEPSADQPRADEPSAEQPRADEVTPVEALHEQSAESAPAVPTAELSAEQSSAEQSSAEQPATEQPSAEVAAAKALDEQSPESADAVPVAGPSHDEPSTGQSSAEQVRSDEPSADEPHSDEPTAERPRAEQPPTDRPSAEEPRADADESSTDEPRSDEATQAEALHEQSPESAHAVPATESSAKQPAADQPSSEQVPADEPHSGEVTAAEAPHKQSAESADAVPAAEPSAEHRVADQPSVEQLPADEPSADKPRADEPSAEQPRADADEPSGDEPHSDEVTPAEAPHEQSAESIDAVPAAEPSTDEPSAEQLRADADEPSGDEPHSDEVTAAEAPHKQSTESAHAVPAAEPSTDEPSTDEPSAEQPAADQPSEQARADEQSADGLRADEPSAEQPHADQPSADEPRAEADEASTDEPRSDETTSAEALREQSAESAHAVPAAEPSHESTNLPASDADTVADAPENAELEAPESTESDTSESDEAGTDEADPAEPDEADSSDETNTAEADGTGADEADVRESDVRESDVRESDVPEADEAETAEADETSASGADGAGADGADVPEADELEADEVGEADTAVEAGTQDPQSDAAAAEAAEGEQETGASEAEASEQLVPDAEVVEAATGSSEVAAAASASPEGAGAEEGPTATEAEDSDDTEAEDSENAGAHEGEATDTAAEGTAAAADEEPQGPATEAAESEVPESDVPESDVPESDVPESDVPAAAATAPDGAAAPAPAAPVASGRVGVVEPVAVVGLAGRFPGAEGVEQFWENLLGGVESVRRFSPEEVGQGDGAVAVSGVLEHVESFDAKFFGLSDREAELMDPAQRLFLEVCHQALEHGGYAGTSGRVGVFAGSGMNLYNRQHQSRDSLATRVAYRLGLTGPAIGVQSAWSSSLVAVHLACQALRSGDADLALAGAAAVQVPQATSYHPTPESILSPSGHVRAFAADADGTVGGNGVAAVLLKRLDQALADGDTVYAVIRGTAVSNADAPSGNQVELIERALERAGFDADTLSYIEANGIGSATADAAEVRSLTTALRRHTDKVGFCTIGSVKPNIGHLDSAAGMAGLIKTILMLQHRMLVPTINYTAPNPALGLDGSPFVIGTEAREWTADGTTLRAGVSAIDAGGTNAQVILEEAPRQIRRGDDGPVVLPLSAPDPDALADLVELYRTDLDHGTGHRLIDLAGTAALGRPAHRHRIAVAGGSEAELVEALGSAQATEVPRGGPGPLGYAFTGQGAARRGMAAGLAARFQVFRSVLDECDRVYHEETGGSLLELLLTPAAGAAEGVWPTETAQPALFAFELALARLWQSFGVTPALVVGHSVGEYAALCVAGALSLQDGVRLTAKRGQLMQRGTVPGAMVSVRADADRVREIARTAGVEVAAGNGPQSFVLTGSEVIVGQLAAQLDRLEVAWQRLDVDRAFHSSLVDPILADFAEIVGEITLKPLRTPMVSSWSGDLLESGTVLDGDYLVGQLRQPVLFGDAVEAVTAAGCRRFLELGPDAVLSPAGRRIAPNSTWIPAQRLGQDPVLATMNGLAELYEQGTEIAWAKVYPDGGRVPLPTYPFRRVYHPVDPSVTVLVGPGTAVAGDNNVIAARVQSNAFERAARAQAPVFDPPSNAAVKRIPLDPPTQPVEPEPAVVEESERSPFALPAETHAIDADYLTQAGALSGSEAERYRESLDVVLDSTCEQLNLDPYDLTVDHTFAELGATPASMAPVIDEINSRFNADLAPDDLFLTYTTPHKLATAVAVQTTKPEPAEPAAADRETTDPEAAEPKATERGAAEPEATEPGAGGVGAAADVAGAGTDGAGGAADVAGAAADGVGAAADVAGAGTDEAGAPADVARTGADGTGAAADGAGGGADVVGTRADAADAADGAARGVGGGVDEESRAARDPRAALAVLGSGLAELAAKVDEAAAATSAAELPGSGMAALMSQQLRVAGQLVDGVTQLMREQLALLGDQPDEPDQTTQATDTEQAEQSEPTEQTDDAELSTQDAPATDEQDAVADRQDAVVGDEQGTSATGRRDVAAATDKRDASADDRQDARQDARQESVAADPQDAQRDDRQESSVAHQQDVAATDEQGAPVTDRQDVAAATDKQDAAASDEQGAPATGRQDVAAATDEQGAAASDEQGAPVAGRQDGAAVDRQEVPAGGVSEESWVDDELGVASERQVASDERRGDLAYWNQVLGGAEPLVLPADHVRAAGDDAVASVKQELEEEVGDAVFAFSRERKLSPVMTMLAAVATVLGRFAAQEDVTIGSALTRPKGDTSTEPRRALPLRIDLSGEPDLGELAQRIRDITAGAFDHAGTDLAVLERDPLFQILVDFEDGDDDLPATVDLRFRLTHHGAGITCTADYRPGLFEQATIERLLDYLAEVLRRATTRPDLRIPQLVIPIERDLKALRELEADIDSSGPIGRARRDAVVAGELSGLHTLFEQQVARTPDAIALVQGDRELTYAELDRRSNAVAWQLADLGVKPGQLVAVRVARGTEMVVAVLAVLKSGAAYLPLDPGVPESRWAFMVQDASAVALVGDDAALADRLGLRLVPVAAVDGDPRARQAPPVRAAADDVAYCIYTSGSTGNPKGVIVPHRGPVNLVRHYLRTRRSLRTLQWTSFGFDVHVQEMFTTLASGAALVLIGEDDRYDPDAVVAALRDHNVERLFMAFSPLTALLATMRRLPELPALREIVAGGEAMVLTHKVRDFLSAHPDCRLFNEYGPTEASIVTTIHEVDPAEDRPSIGRPIEGVVVRLLDAALRPVPVGAVGEIHLGGAAVAQGYLGRPEETEHAFVPDPGHPGARLYRSRDLGRWRADGMLEYLGRADDQVKIRGHRVEPGETEHVLADQPGVVDAVVVAQANPGGDICLIGYVVLEDSDPAVLARLMLDLGKELPIYLVPADLIPIEELPLDDNGRLDRTRLPEPEWLKP
ncbi:amino acid adenylation domain-containing protein [Kribbella sp. NPDC000426]|uniref:non-ribosomal peptide synthetase/type I polyketide synthase n=1 Tax=Kribbella sp. NPDC000426 TaxID=3154255 RepID=UPI0033314647